MTASTTKYCSSVCQIESCEVKVPTDKGKANPLSSTTSTFDDRLYWYLSSTIHNYKTNTALYIQVQVKKPCRPPAKTNTTTTTTLNSIGFRFTVIDSSTSTSRSRSRSVQGTEIKKKKKKKERKRNHVGQQQQHDATGSFSSDAAEEESIPSSDCWGLCRPRRV